MQHDLSINIYQMDSIWSELLIRQNSNFVENIDINNDNALINPILFVYCL